MRNPGNSKQGGHACSVTGRGEVPDAHWTFVIGCLSLLLQQEIVYAMAESYFPGAEVREVPSEFNYETS
jgi:hypothetical protein